MLWLNVMVCKMRKKVMFFFLFFKIFLCSEIGKEDEGMYRCRVENEFGVDEISAFITVTGVGMLLPYLFSFERQRLIIVYKIEI